MKCMENDKSPGNDGLTKEFCVSFWDDIKATFISSIRQSKGKKEKVSQRQAIIKLIQKMGRNKRYINIWRPILFLNVDMKISSKILSKNENKFYHVWYPHNKLRMFKIWTSVKAEDWHLILLKLPISDKLQVFWWQWTSKKLLTHYTKVLNFSFEKIWLWSKHYLMDRNNFEISRIMFH